MDNPNSNCTLLGVRGSPFMAHSQKRKQYSIQDIYMDYCVYLALTIYNIRISRIRYNDKYQSLILCGNIVVNPFLDLYFLSGKTNGIKTITTFSKRKTYLFLRNVHIFWLLYTFAMVFYTPLIESRVGELCYIGLIIAVTAFIQRNISIAIRHDTPGYILLNVWLFFIYAPFYSRRVLKNNWL